MVTRGGYQGCSDMRFGRESTRLVTMRGMRDALSTAMRSVVKDCQQSCGSGDQE